MLIIDTHVHTGDNWEEPIETLIYHMEKNPTTVRKQTGRDSW